MSEDPRIEAAARWLADQQKSPAAVIQTLRQRYGITAAQAAQACTLANRYRVNRVAHG